MKENEIENWICLRPLIYRQLRVLIEISMILHPILKKKKKTFVSKKVNYFCIISTYVF